MVCHEHELGFLCPLAAIAVCTAQGESAESGPH